MTPARTLWDGQSLIIGQIRGIPIGLHFTLLITSLANWVQFMLIYSDSWFAWFFVGILFIVFGHWATLLAHELLGHVWMASRLGGEGERIILWPYGGLSYPKHSGDPADRYKILLAGPLVHLPLGLLAFILYLIFDASSVTSLALFFGYCAHINLQLMIINLIIPAHPLDGCSCLALYCLSIYSTDTTAKIFVALGIPFIIALGWWAWGFGAWNFNAILLCLWLAAQTADLVIRIRQGPAGLARHPMFTIADQMKPRKQGSSGVTGPGARQSAAQSQPGGGGINIDTWSMDPQQMQTGSGGGTVMGPIPQTNWGSGVSGTAGVAVQPPPAATPVVGVPTTRQQAEANRNSPYYPQKDSEIPTGMISGGVAMNNSNVNSPTAVIGGQPGGPNSDDQPIDMNNVVITENISGVPGPQGGGGPQHFNMAENDGQSTTG